MTKDVHSNQFTTTYIPRGSMAIVTTPIQSSGYVAILGQSVGQAPQSKTTLIAGSIKSFGPFAQTERIKVVSTGGPLSYEIIKVDFPSPSEIDGSVGFEDYNDAGTSASPINMTADVYTDIPNDGLGSFTNLAYKPDDVTRMLNTSTGKIDPTEFKLGSTLLIRNDFTITPEANNATLDFRYTLGNGGGGYTLDLSLGRMDRGAGQPYRFTMRVDKIYMGDTNTRDNPIGMQVKCSSEATLVNAGSVLTLIGN